MFTGIIEAIGSVAAIENNAGDLRIYVRSNELDLSDVHMGDSIATNGVCLTVVGLPGDGYWADVSRETLSHTTLTSWVSGQAVNLEKALMAQSRLGGHMVSGHVDGLGEVIARIADARSVRFKIKAPKELTKYIAHKGSITIDGVSLTVNALEEEVFDLNIVPHTIGETIIKDYVVGTKVNLEVDLIARYLERLLQGNAGNGNTATKPAASNIDEGFLAQHGFLK
jgi:riboflavin synthase